MGDDMKKNALIELQNGDWIDVGEVAAVQLREAVTKLGFGPAVDVIGYGRFFVSTIWFEAHKDPAAAQAEREKAIALRAEIAALVNEHRA